MDPADCSAYTTLKNLSTTVKKRKMLKTNVQISKLIIMPIIGYFLLFLSAIDNVKLEQTAIQVPTSKTYIPKANSTSCSSKFDINTLRIPPSVYFETLCAE